MYLSVNVLHTDYKTRSKSPDAWSVELCYLMMSSIRKNAQLHMKFACLVCLDAGRTWQNRSSNDTDSNRLLGAKRLVQISFELLQSLASLDLLL